MARKSRLTWPELVTLGHRDTFMATWKQFPYSEIMRAVVHYEPRKRRDE
jgi:hypothetical protein